MNIIDHEDDGSTIRVTAADEEGNMLQVSITEEGVIIDAFDTKGENVGTNGMTFGEWWDGISFTGV